MYVKHFVNIRVPTCFGVSQIANYPKLLDPGWEIGQIEAFFCLHTENKSQSLNSPDPVDVTIF